MKQGDMLMHDFRAVELLYRMPDKRKGQLWKVRLLFVEPQEVTDYFKPSYKPSYLHSRVKGAH